MLFLFTMYLHLFYFTLKTQQYTLLKQTLDLYNIYSSACLLFYIITTQQVESVI